MTKAGFKNFGFFVVLEANGSKMNGMKYLAREQYNSKLLKSEISRFWDRCKVVKFLSEECFKIYFLISSSY